MFIYFNHLTSFPAYYHFYELKFLTVNISALSPQSAYKAFSSFVPAKCFYLQALFILIPILGCPYLLTLVGPSRNKSPQAYIVFQIVRAVVLSTQAGLPIFTSLFFANNTTLGSGDQPRILLSECRSTVCDEKPLVQVENGAPGGQRAKL